MTRDLSVANDVYERYGLKWADFPTLVTPSAHSDEAELFCAKQALAVYAAYPNAPHAPAHDYIPSRIREAIAGGAFDMRRMIEGGADGPSPSFESEQGYRVVTTDRAGALLVWKNHHLVIALRGTANWQDWIHNFTGETVTTDLIEADDSVQLHKGFTGLAENIAPAVKELVAEFLRVRDGRDPIPALTLCGHSLGGALALNFAAMLKIRNRWQDDCFWIYHLERRPFHLGATYTFGAPCIGKGQIWRFIRRPHYRLIVRGDPVPSTPPGCTPDFQATYLEKATQPAIQPETAFGKLRKAVATRFIPRLGFSVAAHEIEAYIEAIERKIAAKSRP